MLKRILCASLLFAASLASAQTTAVVSGDLIDQSGTATSSHISVDVELATTGSQRCYVAGTGTLVNEKNTYTAAEITAGISLVKNSSITCGSTTGGSRWKFTFKNTSSSSASAARVCTLNITGATNLDNAACLNASATPTATVPTASLFALIDGSNVGWTGNVTHNGHDDTGIGDLDAVSIGGATPGTGAFTTLSATGNVTATAGQNTLNYYKANNRFVVDGVKYAKTVAGLTSALSDAGASGTVIIPPGTTITISACTTDSKGTYGILIDQKSGLQLIAWGVTISQTVNDNSCRALEIRSSKDVVIEGLHINSTHDGVGTAISFRRPSNSDPGFVNTNNVLRNVIIDDVSGAGSSPNIGIEMGVSGEGQVSENRLEHVECNLALTCFKQDGTATEDILYDTTTAIPTTNGFGYDIEARSALLVNTVIGGTSLGITGLKLGSNAETIHLDAPHWEMAQSGNATDTCQAISSTATGLSLTVTGGIISDNRPSGTATLMDLSTGGSTATFANTIISRTGGTANIVSGASAGPFITRIEGQWSNVAHTGSTARFVTDVLGVLTVGSGLNVGQNANTNGAALTIPNNKFLNAENAAGNGNINLVKVDASNNVLIGNNSEITTNGNVTLAGGVNAFNSPLLLNGASATFKTPNVLITPTAPTISSGFGTSPSIATNNGTAAFSVNVGTGGTATSGVIGLPTATNGWNCYCTDITTNSSTVFACKQTASSTSSATVGNFNTSAAAAAWVASDILSVSCFAR